MLIVRGTARSVGITTDIDGLNKAEVAAKIA